MRVITCEQGSPEWFQHKCGLPSASEFHSILAKGQGKTRDAYLRRIVSERLTGVPTETFKFACADRGHEHEPFARTAYEALTGNRVDTTGVLIDDQLWAACSPDGLIGEFGGLELKSVLPTTQVETILGGSVPTEHRAQIQGNIWISGRQWWDFGSFCLEMPERLQLFVIRVQRDQEYIRNLAAEVARFNADAEELIRLLGKVPMNNLEELCKTTV